MLLNESVSDIYIVYLIIKKLIKPWTEWKAYKLGIIDENGNKIKNPKTPEEKKEWNILNIFIWNLKKIIEKYIPGPKITKILAVSFLLKDSITFILANNKSLLSESEINFKISPSTYYSLNYLLSKIKIPNKIYYKPENIKISDIIELTQKINETISNLGNSAGADLYVISSDDALDMDNLAPISNAFGKDYNTYKKDVEDYDKKHKPDFTGKQMKSYVDKINKQQKQFVPDTVKTPDEYIEGFPVFNVNLDDFFKIKFNYKIDDLSDKKLLKFLHTTDSSYVYVKYLGNLLKINTSIFKGEKSEHK